MLNALFVIANHEERKAFKIYRQIDKKVQFYEVKNIENLFRKGFINCRTLIFTKRNTFTKRNDKSNNRIRFQPC